MNVFYSKTEFIYEHGPDPSICRIRTNECFSCIFKSFCECLYRVYINIFMVDLFRLHIAAANVFNCRLFRYSNDLLGHERKRNKRRLNTFADEICRRKR